MNPRYRGWLLLLIVVAVCGTSIWAAAWYRARPISTGMLLKRMPQQDSVILYIDFAELRSAGILQMLEGTKAGEDPDYQNFAQKINFDYREDLDSALVSFAPAGKYMMVKGRFDWKSLRTYAIEGGGNCLRAVCRMAGSTPERRISFFPLQSGLMALAVSRDDAAVTDLTVNPSGPPADVPNAPIWLLIPGTLLKSEENLPSGTKMFARGMDKADRLTLSFAPEGSHLAAKLEVRCRTNEDAVMVASQLSSATLTLRQMIEREHQKPSPSDLSGVLVSGTFRSQGTTVIGYWPVDRAFVETILGGGLS